MTSITVHFKFNWCTFSGSVPAVYTMNELLTPDCLLSIYNENVFFFFFFFFFDILNWKYFSCSVVIEACCNVGNKVCVCVCVCVYFSYEKDFAWRNIDANKRVATRAHVNDWSQSCHHHFTITFFMLSCLSNWRMDSIALKEFLIFDH